MSRRRYRLRCPAAWGALVLAFALTPAGAHEGSGDIRAVLEGVTPALPGVKVSLHTSIAAQLIVENPTGSDLEVLDENGQPFLRIGPEGVLANLNAAAWYLSNSPTGTAEIPTRAQEEGAAPVWGRVAREPSWGWFDHRLHPSRATVPVDLQQNQQDGPVELGRWEVPVRYGGQMARIKGRIEYRLAPGTFVARLTSPGKLAEGIEVSLLQGSVPGIFLESSSSEVVTVLGRDDEPFLRFGPTGVDANRLSPSYLDHLRAKGVPPSEPADPASPPQWENVATVPRYAWIESRAATPRDEAPESAVPGGRTIEVSKWSVPLLIGERRLEVAGITEFVPRDGADPSSGSPVPAAVGAAGIAVAVAVVVLALRRRGRRAT